MTNGKWQMTNGKYSRLRMRLVVDLDQLLHRNMCIDLRGGEPRMTQQFLDVAQVCAAVEQVRGKGMTQRVGTDVVHAGADANVFLNHAAHRASRDSGALIVQKERF